MPGGITGIDQEIAVHLRYLRAADAKTAAAGGVDQLPGAVAGRVLEGRAAGLFADRLRRLAMGLHLGHARADRFRRGDGPTKARRGKDDRGIDAPVAVDELHVGIGKYMAGAVAAQAGGFDQNIPRLAAVGARIYAQLAAA